ncbi:hypothetical protein GN157_00835 [Flavobacterium rakeshii]|uniref:Lipocalin-like domain-containing protein n=1 Tax=Flavobacterium rakeshii TaxID=1038845 RepID=A0A6N8H8J5_9FLAO|nr:hypothetical protein [Flavobacterium rakeshii]MEE1898181.1 hypothetical protein [Flavobacterium rakeshii]MUV02243.1 hypothetical protein [Flavobacterium rakeshii]
MKKFRVLACTLLVTGFGLTSCSSDDDAGDVNNETQIAGTYNLTAVNTAEATDFDEDGTAHIDQMQETDCYDGSKLILNADSTFTFDKNGVVVNTDEGTSGCTDATYTGTWEILNGSGSDVIVRATYQDNNDDDVVLNLVKSGNEITITDEFGSYPDRDEDTGGAILTFGAVEYLYVK